MSLTIYERALDFIHAGAAIGLGSGRAATEFIKLLGDRVKNGFKIRGGVPTSVASEELARGLGIPILSLEQALPLDVAIDGADEWTDDLDLIKGYGRALVREKIVEASSRKFVVLVGPGKKVGILGERGRLPVEVVPLAVPLARVRLRELGWDPVMWTVNGEPGKTDNGNYILDCTIPPEAKIANPAETDRKIREVPGVLGTGIFAGMAQILLLGDEKFELVDERLRRGL